VPEASPRAAIPPGLNGYKSEDLLPIFEVRVFACWHVCVHLLYVCYICSELAPCPHTEVGMRWLVHCSRADNGTPFVAVLSQAYASFGGTAVLSDIDSAKFAKLAKECGLCEGKLTLAAVDVAFSKAKPRGGRRLPFEEFENAIGLLGAWQCMGWSSGGGKPGWVGAVEYASVSPLPPSPPFLACHLCVPRHREVPRAGVPVCVLPCGGHGD
jgi:hypothetical protein